MTMLVARIVALRWLTKSIMKIFVVAAVAAFSSFTFAQAQVVDSQAVIDNRPANQQSDGANQQAEIFYQMQQLQQEVLTLRGLVEEQANDIKRLKQQRMDDYLDLDRRISGLASKPAAQPQALVTAAVAPGAASKSSGNEFQDYRAAINTVLKKQDYQQGESLLKAYISRYPEGKYTANCQYWLGQVYLAGRDFESAKQRFKIVTEQYPNHNKAADSVFKLGKSYHLLGDKAAAKPWLEKAASGTGNVAKEAKSYLDINFR